MEITRRAYSLVTYKAAKEDADPNFYTVTGIATTPAVDRVGDIIDPLGVKFQNPLAFLWQHISSLPIGTVEFDKPTKAGVTFTAKMPKVAEEGELKKRIEEAWQSIKYGLVRAVSIGFRPIEYSFIDNGGIRYNEIEVFELSAVTIPAQAEATIATAKSFDIGAPAASGQIERPDSKAPGAAGKAHPVVKTVKPKELSTMKTIAEQLAEFEATRVAKAARMEEIMNAAAEKGETLDAEQTEEYDGLNAELKSIDAHLGRLRDLEKAKALGAKAVSARIPAGTTEAAADQPARTSFAQVRANPKLEPGVKFARVARCIALGKGSYSDAIRVAEGRYPDDKEVNDVLKAAVVAGSNVSGNWAANLFGADTNVFADFVEYLRPKTILGKFGTGGIPSLRNVPFNVPLIGQTGAGAGFWVGEGKAKPLTAFDFSRTTLTPLKVANIAVLTMESIRDSSPKSDVIIRDQLAAALQARLDTDFIDPAKTASAGVSPASITNGATAIAATGTGDADDVRLDIRALFNQFDLADNDNDDAVLIMSTKNARALGQMVNALGQPEFPGISRSGGELQQVPVIVSRYAGTNVVLLNASDIYLGDEGGVAVDISTEASLEMSDAPAQSALTGSGASMVSMFQTNSIALRAERTINWKRRRTVSVAYLTGAAWGGAVPLS